MGRIQCQDRHRRDIPIPQGRNWKEERGDRFQQVQSLAGQTPTDLMLWHSPLWLNALLFGPTGLVMSPPQLGGVLRWLSMAAGPTPLFCLRRSQPQGFPWQPCPHISGMALYKTKTQTAVFEFEDYSRIWAHTLFHTLCLMTACGTFSQVRHAGYKGQGLSHEPYL